MQTAACQNLTPASEVATFHVSGRRNIEEKNNLCLQDAAAAVDRALAAGHRRLEVRCLAVFYLHSRALGCLKRP